MENKLLINNKNITNNGNFIGGDYQLIINNDIKNHYGNSLINENYCNNSELRNIKNSEKFIKTSFFDYSVNKLQQKQAIMLLGCSGIGKTILSYMITNYFMKNENYKFRFISNPKENDFKGILNEISKNIDEKEVVIIDDFLGDLTLNLSDSRMNELEKFLKEIDNLENKKFIFTTRKTIFQQLINIFNGIYLLIKYNLFQIDLDIYEKEDKAQIFLYYCKKNDIWDNIESLINEKKWEAKTINEILENTNFTPMIIDFATKECQENLPQNYYSVILYLFNHPENIWEKEIKALDSHSRKYMDILLSLSNSHNIKLTVSDECFEKYMKNIEGSNDYIIKNIHSNLKALIKLDDKYLSFSHPSLIEYLDKNITEQTRIDIINSALYLEQIEKMDNTKNLRFIRDFMEVYENKLPRIFGLNVMPLSFEFNGHRSEHINIILTHYLKYLYKFKITENDHQWIVIEVLKKILEYDNYILTFHSTDIINIFSMNYNFHEILNNEKNSQLLFSYANTTNIWNLISKSFNRNEYGYDYYKMPDFVKESLLEILRKICVEELDDYDIEGYVDSELDNYDEDEEVNYDDIIENIRISLNSDLDFSYASNIVDAVLEENSIYSFDDIEKIEDFDDLFEKFWDNNFIEDEIIDILDEKICN